MNEQLNLIGFEDLRITQPTKQTKIKRSSRQRSDSSMHEWWKLSNEERQQGLAGVRAIRAILQKSTSGSDLELRKAS